MLELNRIYNMDCLEGMRLLDGGHKYCVVTDPPFNIGYHYQQYKDKKPENEYWAWLQKIIGSNPCCIIHYPEALYRFASCIGQIPERVVSWVYNSNTKRQHRDAAFFGIKPNFSLVKQPYKNPKDKRVAQRIAAGHEGCDCYDWMEINQVKNVSKIRGGYSHPCMMPLEVMRRLVGVIPPDYVIVDPFIGSGTTAIASIINNRQFIGFELDETYYLEACQRIEQAKQQSI